MKKLEKDARLYDKNLCNTTQTALSKLSLRVTSSGILDLPIFNYHSLSSTAFSSIYSFLNEEAFKHFDQILKDKEQREIVTFSYVLIESAPGSLQLCMIILIVIQRNGFLAFHFWCLFVQQVPQFQNKYSLLLLFENSKAPGISFLHQVASALILDPSWSPPLPGQFFQLFI